ncbi:hypothetical protein ACOSP7_009471 [Xanthoceras sorbifolium]
MGGGDKEARQRGGEATIRGATTTRRCGDSRLDDEEGSSDWRLDNDEGRRSLELWTDGWMEGNLVCAHHHVGSPRCKIIMQVDDASYKFFEWR